MIQVDAARTLGIVYLLETISYIVGVVLELKMTFSNIPISFYLRRIIANTRRSVS